MNLIRIRETSEEITEGEFRALHGNRISGQLYADVLDALGADPILEGPQPTPQPWQRVVRLPSQFVDGYWFSQYALDPETGEDAEAQAAWTATHNEAIRQMIVEAAQKKLDNFAKARGYDSIFTAATYFNSTDTGYAADGAYAVLVRDQMWKQLYAMLEEVQAGTRPAPASFAEIEPDLQITFAWPD